MIELFTPSKKTWLYQVNPAVKFSVFFILFLILFFNQHVAFTMNFMIITGILLYVFSGYSWRRLLLFSIPIVLSFFSSTISMILFGKGEIIWWQWGIIKISEESFFKGLLLGFKAASFGFISLTFLLTTRPILLFYALMQRFKFSPKYAYSFIASIRLIPIIVEEIMTRSNALKVRGVQFPKGFKGIFERMNFFTVPLFAQSIRRAQRLAVAMEAKQFHIGSKRTFFYQTPYTKWDIIFIAIMITLFILAVVLA